MAEKTYTKAYTDFRGVDFSSERSQCDPHRFSDLVNMWRDYRSEHGVAVETSPGFRQLNEKVHMDIRRVCGMHFLPTNDGESMGILVLDRASRYAGFEGNLDLYKVKKDEEGKIVLQAHFEGGFKAYKAPSRISNSVFHQSSLFIVDGHEIYRMAEFDGEPKLARSSEGAYIPKTYVNGEPYEQRNMLTDDFEEEHTTIEETGRLTYRIHEPVILGKGRLYARYDGKWIYFYETAIGGYFDGIYGETIILEDGKTVPRTSLKFATEAEGTKEPVHTGKIKYESAPGVFDYKDIYYIIENGDIVPVHVKYKTFVGNPAMDEEDEKCVRFIVENGYVSAIEIDDPKDSSLLIFGTADPQKFTSVADVRDVMTGNPEFPSNYTAKQAVTECTLIAEFDGRLFFSGNPKLPNSVFYTQRDSTGYNNPFYVGCYNYLNDGTGKTPITAMMVTATQLIVMKDEGEDGSTIYYHTAAYNTSESKVSRDLQPRIYPREEGARGLGCVGVAVNFRDDPVFLSSMGLEAVGKSQVNLERAITHRSSFVDARLRNEDLRNARAVEWEGYLAILVPGGRLYLADSRQISNVQGSAQYEWYFWDDVGVYESTSENPIKERYRYYTSGSFPESVVIDGSAYAVGLWEGTEEHVPSELEIRKSGDAYFVLQETDSGTYAFPVYPTGEMTGGEFREATSLLAVGEYLFFGCSDGSVCVFNTDRRNERHTMPPDAYRHEDRGYFSGCATNSDNLGRTNLNKTTVRRSMVVKTKAFPYSLVTVKAETNLSPMHEVDKIYAGYNDFLHANYSAFTFNTSDACHAIVREGERRWVEKRLSFSAECYQSPFGLISVTYDYRVTGKAKMR